MDLQELITRGRHIFSRASARLDVFNEINGKRNTREIADGLNRHVTSVRRDIVKIADAGLIREKLDRDGEPVKREGFPVYEKIPLARTVSTKYFQNIGERPRRLETPSTASPAKASTRGSTIPTPLSVPLEQEVLDICRRGEDQNYEFKGQRTEIKKITKEIAAMLNTRRGGMILYGIGDDGTIEGSDISRQKFDQPLQNSLHHNVSPAATVSLHSVTVLGSGILVIINPPWDRTHVYHFENKVLIRKGTNVLPARAEESRKLHDGQYVI